MDIKQAQEIIAQAEAARKVLEDHRNKELRDAYQKYEGIGSNAELIAALQNLERESKKRTRAKISADVVSKVKSLAQSGEKGSAIAKSVEASYATVLKVLKGQYDALLGNAAPTKAAKPRKPRKTNNVKLADLTPKETELIKKAKSHADIREIPNGTKNEGKNVLYTVYASIKGIKMRGGKAK